MLLRLNFVDLFTRLMFARTSCVADNSTIAPRSVFYVATGQQYLYSTYRSGSGQEFVSCGGPYREKFINSGDIEVGINLLLSGGKANNKTKLVF